MENSPFQVSMLRREQFFSSAKGETAHSNQLSFCILNGSLSEACESQLCPFSREKASCNWGVLYARARQSLRNPHSGFLKTYSAHLMRVVVNNRALLNGGYEVEDESEEAWPYLLTIHYTKVVAPFCFLLQLLFPCF